MIDAAIAVVLVLVIIIAVKSSMKHFRRRGGRH